MAGDEASHSLTGRFAHLTPSRFLTLAVTHMDIATERFFRAPHIVLTAKEEREYRLGAALLGITERGYRDGLAWDITDELSKALPEGVYRGGLLVPHTIETSFSGSRAGLDTATATKGQELKFTDPSPFIDVLRKKAVVLRLGATELEGLRGDISIPRATQAGTAAFTTQNSGSDVSDTNMLFGAASLTPKTLMSSTSFSRQLLALSQSSFSVDKLVRSDLAADHAVALDLAAIQGSGASGNPTGITNTAGIGSVAGGTNGAQLSWANYVDLEYQVANQNTDADESTFAYVTSPAIRKRARLTDRGGTSTGVMVLADGNLLNGYPFAVTNNIPQTLTKGSASGTCHAVIFGKWSELLIGLWGALEIVDDPYRLKKQGMVELTSFELCDVAVRHAVSFAASLDALP